MRERCNYIAKELVMLFLVWVASLIAGCALAAAICLVTHQNFSMCLFLDLVSKFYYYTYTWNGEYI